MGLGCVLALRVPRPLRGLLLDLRASTQPKPTAANQAIAFDHCLRGSRGTGWLCVLRRSRRSPQSGRGTRSKTYSRP